MLLRVPRGWEVPEREATPREVYFDRRKFLSRGAGACLGAGLAGGIRLGLSAEKDPASRPNESAPGGAVVPAAPTRNPRYKVDQDLTPEIVASRSNIFDELSDDRTKVWEVSKSIEVRPWTIHIGGQVEKSLVLDVDDLIRRMPLEERVYRHRCVEAWAMAVPWIGFPLKSLIDLAKPASKATHVRMVGMVRPDLAPAWNGTRRVFPYYEALTLAEATNDLAFIATGIYGHPLPLQHGAPLRLVVPWKYGFKSIKSISAFQLTNTRPGTFWSELSPDNYAWESNVDPAQTHPWPQAVETLLGTDVTRKTLPFNGYGEFVASLYGS